MKGKLTRITIAITLLGAIVALAYFNASDLYINGQQEWFGYAYNKALQLYQNGESIEHITEHSLDGFPYLRFLIVVSLIAAITFIVLKICFGVKTNISTISSIVVFILFAIPVIIAAHEYYQNYKNSVVNAFMVFHNSWYSEEKSYSEEEWIAQLEQ